MTTQCPGCAELQQQMTELRAEVAAQFGALDRGLTETGLTASRALAESSHAAEGVSGLCGRVEAIEGGVDDIARMTLTWQQDEAPPVAAAFPRRASRHASRTSRPARRYTVGGAA